MKLAAFPIRTVSYLRPQMLFLWVLLIVPAVVGAQEADSSPDPSSSADDSSGDTPAAVEPIAADDTEATVDVADVVEVNPTNEDDEIANRLREIYEATGWFIQPDAIVDDGVVTIVGTADNLQHAEWAEKTAMATADVVAVVNKMNLEVQPFWNLQPAYASLRQLMRETFQVLPLALVALAIIVLSYFLGRAGARFTRWFAPASIDSKLLRQVIANVVGVLIFLVGLYLALRLSGLTRLAVTLLGGTGLVGIAFGFAFRDIAENYLSSILLSINHPFRVGDLIEVAGEKGFVRKLTIRGTILSTLSGSQIQIPNSTVYKEKIINHTSSALTRLTFSVGIGFDDSIEKAQELIMQMLGDHSAVQVDPPPQVLVHSLGSATINLNVLYWIDQREFSTLKVSSSVIRQTKELLATAGISMPDEARELVFPHGVPVVMMDRQADPSDRFPEAPTPDATDRTTARRESPCGAEKVTGEGDLGNEKAEVDRATADDPVILEKENLLEEDDPA